MGFATDRTIEILSNGVLTEFPAPWTVESHRETEVGASVEIRDANRRTVFWVGRKNIDKIPAIELMVHCVNSLASKMKAPDA